MPTASPSPAENAVTANWKTYENKEKGYMIKYPSEAFIHLLCPNEELDLEKRIAGNQDSDEKPLETCGRDGRFDIEVHSLPTPPTAPITDKDWIVAKEQITVATLPADKYIITPSASCFGICAPEWQEEIYINKNGKYFGLYLSNKDFLTDFENMLTTFKFTN